MESSTNTKVLLVVVLMLVGIKFAVMPILDWQNETVEQITQHQTRVDKAQRLIDSQPQLLQQLVSTQQDYQAKVGSYPQFPDSTIFRLETQMNFELLLKTEKLRHNRFFWRSEVDEVAYGDLHFASFNVDFTGNLKDVALFHSKLANEYPQFKVLNMSNEVRNRTQTEKSMGFSSSTFTIAAYYWRGDNS